MLLPEIDEKATIKRCKRKLREYPRWREIAHDGAEQKITQEFTFMPRGGSGVSRPVENIAVRRVDAMNELEANSLGNLPVWFRWVCQIFLYQYSAIVWTI